MYTLLRKYLSDFFALVTTCRKIFQAWFLNKKLAWTCSPEIFSYFIYMLRMDVAFTNYVHFFKDNYLGYWRILIQILGNFLRVAYNMTSSSERNWRWMHTTFGNYIDDKISQADNDSQLHRLSRLTNTLASIPLQYDSKSTEKRLIANTCRHILENWLQKLFPSLKGSCFYNRETTAGEICLG